ERARARPRRVPTTKCRVFAASRKHGEAVSALANRTRFDYWEPKSGAVPMMKRIIVSAALVLVGLCNTNCGSFEPSDSHVGNEQLALAGTTPPQVYGAWHCGDDYCTWGKVRSIANFDATNHWLVDRGDGQPSVNLVSLAFVNPLKLLNL